MKVLTLITLFTCLLFIKPAKAQWSLVWQDEFNGSISSDWTYDIGTGSSGWGNNELQYYRKENATVVNGMLQILAKEESYGGAAYTSSRLKTQGLKSFKYGKIEARISVPAFTGVWPAFWMLGENITLVNWPACGEIDIMEHINAENKVYGTCHWDDNGYANYGGNTAVNVTNFHVYSIEWDEEYIRWYIDGTQFHEIDIANGKNSTHEFHNNFFILLNMAIGGQWPGYTVDKTALPAKMLVDYVRVYQKDSGTTPPVNPTTIEAENYSTMSGVVKENCTEGGQNLGYIEAGDWMAYNNVQFVSSGKYKIEYRVASLNGGGQLSLDLNAGSIVLGKLDIPSTGGWQNWKTISHTVNVDAGIYNLGIYAAAGGWNINWIKISPLTLKSAIVKTENQTDLPSELKVYPVPAKDELHVVGLKGESKAQIIDTQGKVILSTIIESENESIHISTLNNGIYFIKVINNGKTEILKLVKK